MLSKSLTVPRWIYLILIKNWCLERVIHLAWGHSKPSRTTKFILESSILSSLEFALMYLYFYILCFLKILYVGHSSSQVYHLVVNFLRAGAIPLILGTQQYIWVRVYCNCTINLMSISPYFITYLKKLLRSYKLLQDNMN